MLPMRQPVDHSMLGESCSDASDLLSLQQQMAGRAAAAAAAGGYASSPTRDSALAAAMQGYTADSLTAFSNSMTAAAAGLASPVGAVVGTPPAANSPLMAAVASGSPYMTPPANRQHLMHMSGFDLVHSPGSAVLGFSSPVHQYAMTQQLQQQQDAAALQQVYHNHMQAAAANAAAIAAAAAAAVSPGMGSPTAGFIAQSQLEASTAALAAELLTAQSASAVHAAAVHKQQQQLMSSMLLQDMALGGAAPTAAAQCMSPQQQRVALYEAEAAAAAGRQQQALHDMLLLAALPQGSPGGVWC
jgi:hypothetical protein